MFNHEKTTLHINTIPFQHADICAIQPGFLWLRKRFGYVLSPGRTT